MPRVEKTRGGRVYVRPLDQEFSIGDQADVDSDMAAYLTEDRGDFELVDDTGGADTDEPDDDAREEDTPPDDCDRDHDALDAGAECPDCGFITELPDPATVAPFDPSELTVDEIRSRIDENDYDPDDIAALLDAEEDGKNRTTAKDAIETGA